MPYKDAKYWHARQTDPKQYTTARTVHGAFGPGTAAVYGIKPSEGPKGGKSEIQSILFSKQRFDKDQAAAWLKRHGFKTTVESLGGVERLQFVLELNKPDSDDAGSFDLVAKAAYKNLAEQLIKVTDAFNSFKNLLGDRVSTEERMALQSFKEHLAKAMSQLAVFVSKYGKQENQ